MPVFIDSHLHLDFDDFSGDREAVMDRAGAIGIEAYLTIGIRVRDFARVRAVAEAHDNVWCTVGTLPHLVDEEPDVTADELFALTEHPKVVGIGEGGLDRLYGSADWDNQIKVFAAHIEAAQRTQLPLVIHSVREDEAMSAMLRDAHRQMPFPFVIHAFSGGPALLQTGLDLGGYFGFGGLMTYADNEHIRHAAQVVPADRLLLETDSPSMVPAPLIGNRNEPANLIVTARLLGALRSMEVDAVGQQATENFYRLFSKVVRP